MLGWYSKTWIIACSDFCHHLASQNLKRQSAQINFRRNKWNGLPAPSPISHLELTPELHTINTECKESNAGWPALPLIFFYGVHAQTPFRTKRLEDTNSSALLISPSLLLNMLSLLPLKLRQLWMVLWGLRQQYL